MKVVILCGGYGTRIRDVDETIPKPMLRIGRYPILWHIMKYYSSYGFKDFVLALGYKGDVIRNFFINYLSNVNDVTISLGAPGKINFHGTNTESDWTVTLVDTGLNAMTGARIKRVQDFVCGSDFFLTYGDGVGDVDLHSLVNFHNSHGKVLTVTGVRPPGRFGEIGAVKGLVNVFNEKPQAESGRISGGFFVANERIFDYLEDIDSEIFEVKPMQTLVSQRELMMFEHNGFWQPMDTGREFALLNDLYGQGRAPWVRW